MQRVLHTSYTNWNTSATHPYRILVQQTLHPTDFASSVQTLSGVQSEFIQCKISILLKLPVNAHVSVVSPFPPELSQFRPAGIVSETPHYWAAWMAVCITQYALLRQNTWSESLFCAGSSHSHPAEQPYRSHGVLRPSMESSGGKHELQVRECHLVEVIQIFLNIITEES
jgi:hypothetical protein